MLAEMTLQAGKLWKESERVVRKENKREEVCEDRRIFWCISNVVKIMRGTISFAPSLQLHPQPCVYPY